MFGRIPAHEEDFFTEAVTVEFGSRSLKTLSPEDSIILTAISYGKALRSGSPWLKEAHEIASVYSSANSSERQKFLASAQRQGLSRLYRQALGNSLLLFDMDDAKAFRLREERSGIIKMSRPAVEQRQGA